MFQRIKKALYFPVASYFAFFAKIFLMRWKPKIVVITGSSGKTTMLHMFEAQLGTIAKYSHHANSSYGLPFDILGIHRQTLSVFEWPLIFLSTPFKVFQKVPKEKIYIAEADSDRPGEAKFISNLLNQDITIWLNVSRTHSMNFEGLVKSDKNLDEVIADEFSKYILHTKELVIINKDSSLINRFESKINAKVFVISKPKKDDVVKLKFLLPEETAYQIEAVKYLTRYLGVRFDPTFRDFNMPPGRSSVFKGIKNITIIDSTYNANLDSMKVILNLFNNIKSNNKWIVLGDMLEQGKNEESEHRLLANEINKYKFEKIILMGPRVSKYVLPNLKQKAVSFINPKEVLDYSKENITGGETILFKGARFLEGVIENLLLDKNDTKNLVRRELIWEKRRKKFGL